MQSYRLPPNTYPVEITAPDISAYRRGNTGIEYTTTLDSGRAGPHVMLAAIMHGNEICGAIVLDALMRNGVTPVQGKLTLGFCNVAAYAQFDPADPDASRWVDEDLNRVWTAEVLDGERDSVELRRARAIRPLIDEVDYLLDIHSMAHATSALMLAGPLEKGRALAKQVGYPPLVVCDEGHAAGRRMRDYAAFGDASSARNALLVECGQHWAQSTVEAAHLTAMRFLGHFGLIDTGEAAVSPQPQRFVQITHPVTIRGELFRFARPFTGEEVIASAGTLIGWDGEDEVRTPYDDCVLIMPSKRLYRGQTAVRLGRYVSV